MPLFCLPNVIVRVARKVDKPTISSGSTTPYANAVVAWCAERCRSRKSWPTTSAPCGISFTTITHSNGPNVTSLPLHDYPLLGLVRPGRPARSGLCRTGAGTRSGLGAVAQTDHHDRVRRRYNG